MEATDVPVCGEVDSKAKDLESYKPPSPEPSTSTASSSSNSSSSTKQSVYSHVQGIELIPQLRGLRSGRRRGRSRMTQKTKLAIKYAQVISILEPIFLEESLRLQEAATLVAAAIEHFAITVSGLADKLEGKEPEHEYADKISKFKLRQAAEKAKQRAENPEMLQEEPVDIDETSSLDLKEQERRLLEEVEAAVEAITKGDKSAEKFPSLFDMDDDLFSFLKK